MTTNEIRDWLDSGDAVRAKDLVDHLLELSPSPNATRSILLLSAEDFRLLATSTPVLAVRYGSVYQPVNLSANFEIFGLPVYIAPVAHPCLLPIFDDEGWVGLTDDG